MSAPVKGLADLIDAEGKFFAWSGGTDEIIQIHGDLEIAKGSAKRGCPGVVKGYCSTEHRDRQDEVMFQKGLDFSEFLNFGFFNDNHNQDTAAVVGIPDYVEYTPGKGWLTEGNLVDTERAWKIAELAKALQGTSRRLGFSVEGKAEERDGKFILKAKIRNIAITNSPVNTNCQWDLLAKALALGAGARIGNQPSAPGSGRDLVPEHIEGDSDDPDQVKDLYPCTKCADGEAVFKTQAGLDRHTKKLHNRTREGDVPGRIIRKSLVMNFDQASDWVRRQRPGLNDALVQQVVRRAMILAGD